MTWSDDGQTRHCSYDAGVAVAVPVGVNFDHCDIDIVMSNSWNGSLASPEMTSSNDGLADVGDCSADLRTSRTVSWLLVLRSLEKTFCTGIYSSLNQLANYNTLAVQANGMNRRVDSSDKVIHIVQVPGNCGGCGRAIVDRYFLQAAGRSWHVGGCLRCVSCLASLDFNRSCFVRAGLIYCCADYHRSDEKTPQVLFWNVTGADMFVFFFLFCANR